MKSTVDASLYKRRGLTLLAALLVVVAVQFAATPPGIVLAVGEGVLVGEPPMPGTVGTVRIARAAAPSEVVEALRAGFCEPESLLLRDGPRWLGYFPAISLSVGFPASLPAGTEVTVRCASAIEVSYAGPGGTLAGTLTLPPRRGPYPAAILVSGSGGQDRDENIGIPGYVPFRWISDELVGRGVAVLRYDDRGVARSTGRQEAGTTADFAADAAAGVRYLAGRGDIDPSQIGVIGHSEGGIIAAKVAAGGNAVAWVVSVAGTAVRGEEILVLQNRRIAEACGATPQQIDASAAAQRQLVALTRAGDWTGLYSMLTALARQQIAELPPEVRATITPNDIAGVLMSQVVNYSTWLRFFIDDNPADDWAKVRQPVLALFGGKDTQVPVDQNRTPLEAALQRAGNHDVTVTLFPSANHLFKAASTGCPSEYSAPPMEFVPGFLETIGAWVEQRLLPAEPR